MRIAAKWQAHSENPPWELKPDGYPPKPAQQRPGAGNEAPSSVAAPRSAFLARRRCHPS